MPVLAPTASAQRLALSHRDVPAPDTALGPGCPASLQHPLPNPSHRGQGAGREQPLTHTSLGQGDAKQPRTSLGVRPRDPSLRDAQHGTAPSGRCSSAFLLNCDESIYSEALQTCVGAACISINAL